MATYTPNYGLHQWVPEDNFQRSDFNTDFQKIDTAIAGLRNTIGSKIELVYGYYVGNGKSSRLINLGFDPLAVLVEYYNGMRNNGYGAPWGGLSIKGFPSISGKKAVTLSSGGFLVYVDDYLQTNALDQYYAYLAFRTVTS